MYIIYIYDFLKNSRLTPEKVIKNYLFPPIK